MANNDNGVLTIKDENGQPLSVSVSAHEVQLIDTFRHLNARGREVLIDISLNLAGIADSAFAASDGEARSIWDEPA